MTDLPLSKPVKGTFVEKWKPKKSLPKWKQLAQVYGGTWVFDRASTWTCDDGRSLKRGPGGELYLHGDGEPKLVTDLW